MVLQASLASCIPPKHPLIVLSWEGERGAALCPLSPSRVLTPQALGGPSLHPLIFGGTKGKQSRGAVRSQRAQPGERAREGETLSND